MSIETEQFFSKFFLLSSDLFCVANVQWNFNRINPAFTKFLGYEEGELLEKPFFDFVHPEDVSVTRDEVAALAKGNSLARFRNRYKCKDGEYKWLEWNVTPIIEENLIFASARDVTLQLKMENQFQIILKELKDLQLEDQLKLALKEIRDLQLAIDHAAIVSITDVTGTITYVNEKFCEISKYNQEELLGQNHRIIKSEYHPKSFFEEMWKTISSGNIWRGEICNYNKNCQLYWITSTIIPVLNIYNKPDRYVSIHFDITERKRIEAALSESTTRFSAVLNGATQSSIIATDINGLITVFNSGAEHLLGYAANEVIGKHSLELIHVSEEIETYGKELSFKFGKKINGFEVFVEESKHGNYGEREWTYIRKDGSTFPVSLTITILTNEDNNVVGYLGVAIDISDRKKSEKYQKINFAITRILEESVSLEEASPRLLKTICENLEWHAASIWTLHNDETLCCLDFYQHPIVNINTFESRTFSMKLTSGVDLPGRVLSSKSLEWIPDITIDKNFLRAWVAGQDGIHTGVGVPLKIKNKVVGVIEFFNIMTLLPDDRLINSIEDIGNRIGQFIARKEVEQLVKDSEQKFRTLTDFAPIGIYLTDAKGNCLYTNPYWQILTGLTLAESFNQGWVISIHPNDREQVLKIWTEAITKNELFKLEYRIVVNELVTPIFSCAIPFFDKDAQVVGYVGTVEDITEHKRIETEIARARDVAIETARIKSEFLANMSHEIRTPMNGVIGMTTLLLQTELSPDQLEKVQILERSAESLLTIINDILDFSKIEAGKLKLEYTDFDLKDIVEDVIEFLSTDANKKGIDLYYLFSKTIPNKINGDPVRIRQVLTNLVSNAIKFTEKGHVTVRVSKFDCEHNVARVRFEIVDTGIGIDRNTQEKLFGAFSQADTSVTRRFGGTGLGLAICKKIITLMGGEIGVESEINKGSTFFFTLDFPIAEQNVSISFVQEEYKNIRILIVDDNQINQEVLSLFLTSWGIKNQEIVSTAANALQQLEQSYKEETPFSLVIADLIMPNMDGLELVELIRANPNYNYTKLIIISSGWIDYREKALSLGANAYIHKPIKQDQLKQCIASLLGTLQNKSNSLRSDIQDSQSGDILMTNQPQSRGHVLIVEDNEVNQKVILGMVKSLNYTADCVHNGQEAIEKINETHYSGILMDWHMPVMDGFSATKIIRAQDKYKKIPIIGITANVLPGDEQKVIEAGINAYVSKPISLKLLKTTLDTWIDGYKEEQLIKKNQRCDFEKFNVLDSSTLESLAQLQMEGVANVVKCAIESYLSQTPQRLENLVQSLVVNDSNLLAETARAIRSNSTLIGAIRVSEICVVLEEVCKKNDWEQVINLIGQLKKEYELVKEYLEKNYLD